LKYDPENVTPGPALGTWITGHIQKDTIFLRLLLQTITLYHYNTVDFTETLNFEVSAILV
jgi:hypothetical protein